LSSSVTFKITATTLVVTVSAFTFSVPAFASTPSVKVGNASAASFLTRLKSSGSSPWKDRSGPYNGFGPSPTYLFTTTDPSGLACSVYAYRDPNLAEYDRSEGNFPTDSRPFWYFKDYATGYSIVAEAGSLKTKCGKAIVKAFNLSN
jgi:hypothetical protein